MPVSSGGRRHEPSYLQKQPARHIASAKTPPFSTPPSGAARKIGSTVRRREHPSRPRAHRQVRPAVVPPPMSDPHRARKGRRRRGQIPWGHSLVTFLSEAYRNDTVFLLCPCAARARAALPHPVRQRPASMRGDPRGMSVDLPVPHPDSRRGQRGRLLDPLRASPSVPPRSRAPAHQQCGTSCCARARAAFGCCR
jgi:hypothetical protein